MRELQGNLESLFPNSPRRRQGQIPVLFEEDWHAAGPSTCIINSRGPRFFGRKFQHPEQVRPGGGNIARVDQQLRDGPECLVHYFVQLRRFVRQRSLQPFQSQVAMLLHGGGDGRQRTGHGVIRMGLQKLVRRLSEPLLVAHLQLGHALQRQQAGAAALQFQLPVQQAHRPGPLSALEGIDDLVQIAQHVLCAAQNLIFLGIPPRQDWYTSKAMTRSRFPLRVRNQGQSPGGRQHNAPQPAPYEVRQSSRFQPPWRAGGASGVGPYS